MIAVLAAFFAGLGWSWSRRQSPLAPLATSSKAPVERQKSAEAQYVYALFADNEEAWRAVSDYYPGTYFDLRAEQQLARMYLQQEDYSRALPLFDKLEDLDDDQVRQLKGFGAPAGSKESDLEAEFESFGLAGSAVVLYHAGDSAAAASKLAELWPRRRFLDPQMGNWIRQIINKSGRLHHDKTLQQWDQWLKPQNGKAAAKSAAEPSSATK